MKTAARGRGEVSAIALTLMFSALAAIGAVALLLIG